MPSVPSLPSILMINSFADHIKIIINPSTGDSPIAYKIWSASWASPDAGDYTLVGEFIYTDRFDLYSKSCAENGYSSYFDPNLTLPRVNAPTAYGASQGAFTNKISLAWTKGTVQNGAMRYYKVSAINSYGETALSLNPVTGQMMDTFSGTEIFYGTSAATVTTKFSGTYQSSFDHTGRSAGQTFYYLMRSLSTGGNRSTYTAVFSGYTQALTVTLPGTPILYFGSEIYYDRIRLSWTAADAGNAASVAYHIYGSELPTSGFAKISALDTLLLTADVLAANMIAIGKTIGSITLGAAAGQATKNTTAKADSITLTIAAGTVTAGAYRYFKVSARNSVGEGSLSNVVLGTLGDSAASVDIYHSATEEGEYTLLASGQTGTYEHTGLGAAETHWYKVITRTAQSQTGSLVSAAAFYGNTTVIPDAPDTPIMQVTPGFPEIALRWDAQADVSSYTLYTGVSPTDMSELTTASGISVAATFGVAVLSAHEKVGAAGINLSVLSPNVISASDGDYENKILLRFSEKDILRGKEIFFSIKATNTGGDSDVSSARVGYFTDTKNGIEIYRSATEGGSYSLIATVAAGVTEYEDTGRTASTTYWYKLKAKGAVTGTTYSTLSAAFSGATGAASGVAPSAPTGVTATKGTYHDRVRVQWSKAAGATTYEVYSKAAGGAWALVGEVGDVSYADIYETESGDRLYDASLTAPTLSVPGIAASTALSGKVRITSTYSSDNMVPGGQKIFSVIAKNGTGSSDYSVTDVGYRNDTLTATPVTIYAASANPADPGSYSLLVAGVAQTYDHGIYVDGATRYYKTKLVSTNGYESSLTSYVTGTTAAAATGPAAPTGLTASAGTYTEKAALAWSASTGATGYKIYASPNALPRVWTYLGAVTGQVTADVRADTSGDVQDARLTAPEITLPTVYSASHDEYDDKIRLQWTNGILTAGATLVFAVTAYNGDGESDKSTEASGYRKGEITGTEIVKSETQAGTFVALATDTDGSPYDHEGLDPEQTFWYKLRMKVEDAA